MRTRPIKNVPASIHTRLLNLARARGTQLNFLLQLGGRNWSLGGPSHPIGEETNE